MSDNQSNDQAVNTSGNRRCLRCGAALPATSTDQTCPACLISRALDATGETLAMGADDQVTGATRIAPVTAGSTALPVPTQFPCKFGGYRLLGFLGRGGMGSVYEAEERATGRRVALKMLEQQLDSPEMRQRFLREGRLAARVNHPNSLYIFGSDEIEGQPVITMEIAGSGTLKDLIKQRGPLPVAEAVDAILGVISGLEAAFAEGVLHRDIKPSNCFLCPDGSVKVGDFGLSVSTLARSDSFITAHGKILGTPAYASPEQLRGDDLDLRADIYSVGATLFTLLTDRAPFEGDNAVQVVANAVNQKPKPLSAFRDDLPVGLERVMARCLAKEPAGRYPNYPALRNELLPFSSQVPKPASLKVRALAGWIDYLAAFLIPYVAIMLSVGSVAVHVQPLVERTLFSARYYFLFLALGFLYFSLAEGLWGAGLGKRIMGLSVVRSDGRAPGLIRGLLRVAVPILSIEVIRVPFLLATISMPEVRLMSGAQAWLYVGASNVCAWFPVLLTLTARRHNGFATVWDLLTGTRVVIRPKDLVRMPLERSTGQPPASADEQAALLGPYRIIDEIVPGRWIVASDPVLRRPVWLLRQDESPLPLARRNLSRPGRLRWLQTIEANQVNWNAFEAIAGVPFTHLVENGHRLPWVTLRQWLHDLASELWAATGDDPLPSKLSLDHVWITRQGRAILLDEPWPHAAAPAKLIRVGDLAGQQRFLNAVAEHLEPTSVPLHARPVLQNLAAGKFEKLSFLAGILRGLLDKPAEVSQRIRAGSIFMLPVYVWLMVAIGSVGAGDPSQPLVFGSAPWIALTSALVVLGVIAVIQILGLPIRTTASYAIFRLAIIDDKGERAGLARRLVRWSVVWLPLVAPMSIVALLAEKGETMAFASALALLLVWIGGAVYAAVHPNRGLQDRMAGTWVVRR